MIKTSYQSWNNVMCVYDKGAQFELYYMPSTYNFARYGLLHENNKTFRSVNYKEFRSSNCSSVFVLLILSPSSFRLIFAKY